MMGTEASASLANACVRAVPSTPRARAPTPVGVSLDTRTRDDYGDRSLAARWSSLVARRAHNPKVGGSNPPRATKLSAESRSFDSAVFLLSVPSRYSACSCGSRLRAEEHRNTTVRTALMSSRRARQHFSRRPRIDVGTARRIIGTAVPGADIGSRLETSAKRSTIVTVPRACGECRRYPARTSAWLIPLRKSQ